METESLFSPALRRAIESETYMRTTRGFDEQFFAKLEDKRARNRTWRGQIERLCEVEISGVAVWRLLGSGMAGSALPALVLACSLSSPAAPATPVIPQPLLAFTPFNQRKFWEEEAWKSPFRSARFALLDPNFNLGGESCASPFTA
ncbi:hypothetical protein EON80_23230 [bacterium]|nr:MAG: hypothetical protein EON80_23230 [bacterium]